MDRSLAYDQSLDTPIFNRRTETIVKGHNARSRLKSPAGEQSL
jgi:hypothetical protein